MGPTSDLSLTGAPQAAELARSRWLAWLFLIYALPAVIFSAVAMPPFQVAADENAHVLRADQIARGTLIAHGLGTVDGGLVDFVALYESMWFHPEVKQTEALARRAGAIGWAGPRDGVNFQNTAQYGPLLYAPQAISMLSGLTLAHTLLLARLINGLLCCAIGFAAVATCRRGRALTFATLLLPMTLSQIGSASQDALLITLSLLTVALASRVLAQERPATTTEFAVFACVVMATTLARPSQIALALLAPAFVGWRDPVWRQKALVALLAAAPIAIWMRLLKTLMPPAPPGSSASLQFEHLITHPLALPTVMAQTLIRDRQWLWETVIGRLGWLDTTMPGWYYIAATVVLAIALIAPGNRGPSLRPAVLGIVTLLGLLTLTCFALYLSWTPVDKPWIDGLQGRYMLPVLPLVAWLVPSYSPRLEKALALTWWPVLLFPIVTLAILPGVIMERYYGSWQVMAASLRALLLS